MDWLLDSPVSTKVACSVIVMLAVGIIGFVVGTKELITCTLGGLYKSMVGLFDVGDRIEVNGVRGDVIDQTLVSTTILEIGPNDVVHQYTGRKITIPNSQFLSHPVENEGFTDNFTFHVFSVPVARSVDIEKVETILLEEANRVCADYILEAEDLSRT